MIITAWQAYSIAKLGIKNNQIKQEKKPQSEKIQEGAKKNNNNKRNQQPKVIVIK